MTDRYVALGDSMAAGPGIPPGAPGAPWTAGRSARNYPHLVAAQLGMELVDVSYQGATTAHLLRDKQLGAPPQIEALDGSESLVTITIGGNDVGFVPLLVAGCLPWPLRWTIGLGCVIRHLLDPAAREAALAEAALSLQEVGATVRARAPRARVLFVDYLTRLPPKGVKAPPLSDKDADLGRHVASELERLIGEAARATGCELVRATAASRSHHAWSADPWTTKWYIPLPGRVAPLHANPAGMQVVAELVTAQVIAGSPSPHTVDVD